MTIQKLLIANRSEIAMRIIKTARAHGIATVAVYAPQDRLAPFVFAADEAYPLVHDGMQAYLDQDHIISIAKRAGVDAIHPGYGFLAENDSFALRVEAAGITWIGPTRTRSK